MVSIMVEEEVVMAPTTLGEEISSCIVMEEVDFKWEEEDSITLLVEEDRLCNLNPNSFLSRVMSWF
jgi:hypothetical protein